MSLKDVFQGEVGEQIGQIEQILSSAGYKTELSNDEKHGLWEIETVSAGGRKVKIDWELASQVEFQRAVEIYKRL